MSNSRVKVQKEDPDFIARNAMLEIGSKNIQTPCRALNLTDNNDCESIRITNPEVRGLNELYRRVNEEFLRKLGQSNALQSRFVSKIVNPMNAVASKEINLLFLEYGAEHIPSNEEIEYLFDLLYGPMNDVLIPPIIRGVSPGDYLKFLEDFFTVLESYNKKPLLGLIPYGAHRDLDPILAFYINKGLTLYAIDLNGRHPLLFHPHLVRVHRRLQQLRREYGQEYYLHGLNVGFGRALRSKEAVPAKDVFSFIYGLDSFGAPHVPPRLPPDVYGRLARPPEYKRFRLFNRSDYGYYRVDLISSPGVFGQERNASVDVDSFRQVIDLNRIRNMQKAFNAERHGLEANAIRQRIADERLKKHVEEKRYARENLRSLAKLASEVRRTSLSDF
jgi:hypothetical protein